jgi:hypothetical protein
MNPDDFKPDDFRTVIRYTIKPEQIMDFVNDLHRLQFDYIESAVEASGYKEANKAIKRIIELK